MTPLDTFELLIELLMEQRAKQGLTMRPTVSEVKSFILNFDIELRNELERAGVSTLSELVAKEQDQ